MTVFHTKRRINKLVVKRLLRRREYGLLGRLFEFTPVLFDDGTFDWRSAPPRLMAFFQTPSDSSKKVNLPIKIIGVRHLLYQKQEGKCYYCGKHTPESKWTVDHVHPRSRRHERKEQGRNKVGACFACNHAKGNMTLTEFLETDYLPENRRALLGFTDPPVLKWRQAKEEHQYRITA